MIREVLEKLDKSTNESIDVQSQSYQIWLSNKQTLEDNVDILEENF